MPGENIVGLDLGSSSVRALLFDRNFTQYEGLGFQKKYEIITSPDGAVELDPNVVFDAACECLDSLHQQMIQRGLRAAGIGISTFWHSFLGISEDDKPTTAIIHLFDTRSAKQVDELTHTFDPSWVHAITGCVLHTSYWPAKLLWLRQNKPDLFETTSRWVSPGEYLLLKVAGQGAESTSMVSATGFWDQRKNDYCEELLMACAVRTDQLAPVESLDTPCRTLEPPFAARWPLFSGIPWYPAYGDGACNSIGSGCATPEQFALMVGTSGAMRVVIKQNTVTIPSGIWCYRVNRERFILGGAVSNGGEVYRWATRILRLPDNAEEKIAERQPGVHGLTMLPYLAGERSPYWRPELRAMITGMSLSTTAVDILQACLESVSLRFKQIYTLLTRPFAAPASLVASGGALLKSRTWLQMMTDALARPITECLEPEASSRGAAMIAAEQMGVLASLEEVSVRLGTTLRPKPERTEAYERLLERDGRLFDTFYGATSPLAPARSISGAGRTD
ncbi:MAG: hypothetical protein JO108_16020 [Acidobacteriaceae bacterium]|nr:hypothetical protein [Acidobacteriaceae bacterium]